jgi:lipopolysaccharide/colanic/teichoic acid biosynthesis glycosyltransferase
VRRSARGLLYASTVAVVLGLGEIHAAWIGDYDFTGTSRFGWSIAYIVLLSLAAYGAGLPDLPRRLRSALPTSAAAVLAAAVAISLLQLAVGSALLPRFVVFWSALFLVPAYVLCAMLAAGGRSRGEDRDRVVAVVSNEEAAALTADLAHDPERPATLVSWLETDEARPGDAVEEPLMTTAQRLSATVLVLDRAAQNDESVVVQAAALHERGVRVRTLSLFYEEWLGKLPVAELERVSLMFDIGEVHRVRYGRAKRVVDVAAAAAGTCVLLVLLPFVVVGDAVANRGPLFYRQARVGKQGRIFQISKFRTMRVGAPEAAEWTTVDDPRVTPFGRLLRRTHLDELPQVWNILKGDLSIVGPRPEQPQYVSELEEKIPFYGLRHLVRPGVTGWAQVKYGYAGSESAAIEKLQYEFYYLRHQGLSLDLRVLGRTVRSVIGLRGR